MTQLLFAILLLIQAPAMRPGTGVVSGRILFSDGTPVVGAMVTSVPVPEAARPSPAGPFPGRLGGFTDASGGFRVQNLAPGRYYFRFGRTDAIYYPGVINESAALIVTVTNTPIENLSFTLPPSLSGVRVLGHVIAPANQPLLAASRQVQINGGFVGQLSGPIAADGTFEIPHVRPGRYSITVTLAPGMQPRPITVSDSDLTGVKLAIPRLVPVEGRLVVEGSNARPRFVLTLESSVFRSGLPLMAEQPAPIAFPEGEYLPRVTTMPEGYYLKSLTAGKANLLVNSMKITPADESMSVVATVAASPGVHVSGRVRVDGGAAGSSLKNMLFLGKAVDQVVEVPLETDGSFNLDKVMPGVYFARVTLSSNLAAPLVSVTIPDKDVRDVEITVPGEVDVFGRVAVDGYGPPPKFSLLLFGGATAGWTPAKPGELPALSAEALFAFQRGSGAKEGTQAVQLDVDALPDGSFKLKLPEGDYRVAAAPGANGVPAAYFVRSLTYGSSDLLKESMTVSASNYAELQVGFGTTAPSPWARVSGRVKGYDLAKGPLRVALEGRTTATIDTPVNPDGTFEFLRTLQGTTYTARVVPANDAASAPTVTVADKDVQGVEIVVPQEQDVRIVATSEDGVPIPDFVMTLAGTGSTVSVLVKPERDGAFRKKLPGDERRVRFSGFAIGYVVKAASYGGTDLLKDPLKLTSNDSTELKVQFALDPALPFGSLRGRVSGVDAQRNAIQLVLHGVTSFSSFETPLNPDGSFSFAKLPQGVYVPTLAGARISGMLSPSTVVVSGADLSEIEITVPKQTARDRNTSADDAPAGVTVSNLVAGREDTNESAAIANLRTINTALVGYLSSNGGRYGSLADLIKAGLLDGRFNGAISGFSYSIINAGGTYAAAAMPTSGGTGRYGFYALSDAVVRYSTLDLLAPPRQAGNPVQ